MICMSKRDLRNNTMNYQEKFNQKKKGRNRSRGGLFNSSLSINAFAFPVILEAPWKLPPLLTALCLPQGLVQCSFTHRAAFCVQ